MGFLACRLGKAHSRVGSAVTLPDPPSKVLVPVDFGESSLQALERAMEFAHAVGASVDVLYVWAAPYAPEPIHDQDAITPQNLFDRAREQCADEMRKFVQPFKDRFDVEVHWYVESGEPREKLLAHVDLHHCSMIVMGTHGRQALSRWMLGSVAEFVLRHANCPVMIVPKRAAKA
jgi:nucleotide-binding universal stress UspA family protein